MIPVVLLGGLNIVRALGLARIPVIVASSDRRTPSMASRYCAGVIELPPIAERDAYVEALARAGRELAARHGKPVPLFYDNDDRLALVQDCRAALAPHFALLLNEPELGDALLDKSRFQALAERVALPVPRRIEWDALDAERGPVLVKPKTRTAWDHSSVRLQLFGGAGKARVFGSGREAHADALVAQLAGQLSFQEYVPGGDDAIWSFHGFCASGGEVLEWFVGRKIRTFPALTGDSSYLRLARDDGLVALGRRIAAQLRLAGVFKMDFKRSRATGRFYLLEINTRFNLWHYLGAVNGVNLPRVAYDFLVEGRLPERSVAKTRARWLSLRYDWLAYRELKARGEITTAAWLWSLAQAPKVYDLFSWSDPLPLARRLAIRAERLSRRVATRWKRRPNASTSGV
ncbi:MAG TPA: ATP-grasp domain-containing protein [Burkholderiales bacterium]